MRNWNEPLTISPVSLSLFLQYLWGIETRFPVQEGGGCVLVFTVPMRNWNKLLNNRSSNKPHVFTVPMRNWNGTRPASTFLLRMVFTVPMRNWNLRYSVLCEIDLKSFYSTYEELKRTIWPSNISKFFLCFYSTYEELKLFFVYPNVLLTTSFLQYLWGIETMDMITNMAYFTLFLQYLWGIETKLLFCRYSDQVKFLQYLWGIETDLVWRRSELAELFLQYLWGIETLLNPFPNAS